MGERERERRGSNEIVKIYFIIGMFLINAKPIFCSENFFLVLSTNKFSYLLICNPLCSAMAEDPKTADAIVLGTLDFGENDCSVFMSASYEERDGKF